MTLWISRQFRVNIMKLAYNIILPSGETEENLPPVILLHGMMDSRKTWKGLDEKIAKFTGRKVYALDARNHGESPWSSEFNFDILAADLDEFLLQHHILKAVFIGHSMGGRTALTLALKKPERIEMLIVEDMTPRNFSPRAGSIVVHLLKLMQESLHAIPSNASDQVARTSIATFMSSLLPPEQISATKNKYDLSMLPLKKEGNQYMWQANLEVIKDMLTTEKIRQNLSGICMKDALFLYGTKSFFKVETDELIPKFFPCAIRVGIDAGHLIHAERPQEFLREVVNFICKKETVLSKY